METPEHFEKKSVLFSLSARELGYNEALEKTNAKELYEALNDICKALKFCSLYEKSTFLTQYEEAAINALEKANKP